MQFTAMLITFLAWIVGSSHPEKVSQSHKHAVVAWEQFKLTLLTGSFAEQLENNINEIVRMNHREKRRAVRRE